MIIPTTYAAALTLALLAVFFWGSWANTLKLAKGWRFELFYFDFAFGVLLITLAAAFTLGSMGEELTVTDNFMIAGKRQMAWALAAGVVFNLANMLLLAAISVSGLAIAAPIGLGVALIVASLWDFLINGRHNALLLFSGAGLVLIATIVTIVAYRFDAEVDGEITDAFSLKALILALAGGILMGSFHPLVEMARVADIGLGPYSVALLLGIALFFSTFVYSLYFMNLPVEGPPVGLSEYFRGNLKTHVLGLLGGVLLACGLVAHLVAGASPLAGPGAGNLVALGGSALVSALWGMFAWKEFGGSELRVKLLLMLMSVLFLAGLALIWIAPLQ